MAGAAGVKGAVGDGEVPGGERGVVAGGGTFAVAVSAWGGPDGDDAGEFGDAGECADVDDSGRGAAEYWVLLEAQDAGGAQLFIWADERRVWVYFDAGGVDPWQDGIAAPHFWVDPDILKTVMAKYGI